MNESIKHIARLETLRNQFGNEITAEKIRCLNSIDIKSLKSKPALQNGYSLLLFVAAYPDNRTVYDLTNKLLLQLQEHVGENEQLQYALYNSGITGTKICAAYSFGLVKWMRENRRNEIRLVDFDAADSKIQSVLSVLMLKTESEILQDGNAEWKGWLRDMRATGNDLLEQLIDIFDSSDIRPAVKEELWNTIAPNVEITFASHCCLPESLTAVYFHRSIYRKAYKRLVIKSPKPVSLSAPEAEQVLGCARMILVRKLRELDPISFSSPVHVSLYHLPRGISIALTGMVPSYRHPLESYMGYLVFKNGLPVAYAGSWILFDSARIGLNVFADYRGGEAKYIFDQVLQLHAKVYNLKRFTVDPYQLGKANSDGIQSGAFWIYYQAGFRPVKKEQRDLAVAEGLKIKVNRKHRTSVPVLKKLADSRMELVLDKRAVQFDATDLSRVYAFILKNKYKGNRILAEKDASKKLAKTLQIKNIGDEKMKEVLKNWALILLNKDKTFKGNKVLQNELKKLLKLKAGGAEEVYIHAMQKSSALKKQIAGIIQECTIK